MEAENRALEPWEKVCEHRIDLRTAWFAGFALWKRVH
jgi:hypothetical protein